MNPAFSYPKVNHEKPTTGAFGLTVSARFVLVAGTGLEPVTFGL